MSSINASFADLRVLVVDDEYLIAMHIQGLAEDLGCIVLGPAATIEEALAIIKSETVDCVLLDANLHGKSSTPIALELLVKAIPFVVVTGYAELRLDSDALEGAPRLSKPFNEMQFEAVMAATFLG